jgi:hypothetical protein
MIGAMLGAEMLDCEGHKPRAGQHLRTVDARNKARLVHDLSPHTLKD